MLINALMIGYFSIRSGAGIARAFFNGAIGGLFPVVVALSFFGSHGSALAAGALTFAAIVWLLILDW